jgi:hypothetical protein
MTKQMGFCIFLFLYETTLLQVDCVGVPLVSTLDLRLTLQVDCVVGVPLVGTLDLRLTLVYSNWCKM